jgi:protocatechuate 3,4-dioxygenase beta subunit
MGAAGRQVLGLILFGAALAAGLLLPRPAHRAEPLSGPMIRLCAPDGSPMAGVRVAYYSRDALGDGVGYAGESLTGPLGCAPRPPPGRFGEVVAVVSAPKYAGEVFPDPAPGAVLTLREGEAVEGFVLDLAGRPIAGARVFSPPEPPAARETTSDGAGRFRLPPVVGNAALRAEAPGYAPLELSLSLYPDEDRDVVFYLVRGRTISGRVTDSAGEPLRDTVVELDQEVRSFRRTDRDGRFSFDEVLCDWEVLLMPHGEGLVGRRGTAVAGQTDLALRLYRPATVRGTALDAATGIPPAGLSVAGGEAGPGGRFVLTGLLPGETKVEARAGTLLGEVSVPLREGEERRDVVVALRPARFAAPDDHRPGHLLTIRAAEAGTGRPAAGVLVRGGRGERMQADAEGRVLILLPPGRHRVRLGGPFDRYEERILEFTVPEEDDLRAELTPNRVVTLELVGGWAQPESKFWLRCDGEVVEKRISGRSGEFFAPVDRTFDVYVEARHYLPVWREVETLPADGRIILALTEGPVITGRCLGAGDHPLPKVVVEVEEEPLTARTETLGDGVFRLGGLDPGRYRVLLYARNVRTRHFRAEVHAGEVVDLGDVRMRPPATMAVRVIDSAGAPVCGAVVESALLVSAVAVTDAAGLALLPGRNEEETLRVHAEGFLDAWPEVSVPEDAERVDVTVRLFRPARLLVRVVDREGRPVEVEPPRTIQARAGGPGEILVDGLSPGPFELAIEDRAERTGTLKTLLLEGESRVETLVVE